MEQGCISEIYEAEDENCKDRKKRTTEQKITLRKFRCLLKSLFENKVLVKCIYKCLCRERVKEAERK